MKFLVKCLTGRIILKSDIPRASDTVFKPAIPLQLAAKVKRAALRKKRNMFLENRLLLVKLLNQKLLSEEGRRAFELMTSENKKMVYSLLEKPENVVKLRRAFLPNASDADRIFLSKLVSSELPLCFFPSILRACNNARSPEAKKVISKNLADFLLLLGKNKNKPVSSFERMLAFSVSWVLLKSGSKDNLESVAKFVAENFVNFEVSPQNKNHELYLRLKKNISDFLFKFGGEKTILLYKDHLLDKTFNESDKKLGQLLVRRLQRKTGSRTILLGGKLRGRAIVREINSSSLNRWLSALNAKELWKSLGFDYVPIEPILEKKVNGKKVKRIYSIMKRGTNGILTGQKRVFAGIINGVILAYFLENPKNARFVLQLERDKKTIESGLIQLGINHGHLHYGNYLVEMHNGKPRIYLIDFDKAKRLTR
jgi:thiamine kinase-like enzyme